MCFLPLKIQCCEIRYHYPHQKEGTPKGCFLFGNEAGLEPISMQQSGGLLQPPVQTLVATLIVSRPVARTTEKPVPLVPVFS